ncbi:Centromere/kinetochore Zw10-domain-containing protein [Irpex lacteus]|nr:Centromere/kinetochore Zw10-domain-containing protein [Irpex lacteus]
MAFPVPSHLPRRKNQDVSTKLLTEISETNFKSLSQEVASKWVAELNVAIRQTKEEIHKRVHSELPAFDQQLSSSKYVQERLHALETNVDTLSTTLSHPETGLVPNLLSTLTRHAALAQELSDAEVMHQAMSHLAHIKREMQSLASLVGEGRLPDAVALCNSLERLLASAPPPLPATDVVRDVQRRFRALKDRAEEQLHEAYSRSVVISASEFVVRPSVQVRASDTILSLPDILSSLSPASLASLVNTLRRDITTHYIDFLLSQPASVEQSSTKQPTGTSELKLTIFPAPPNTENPSSRLENISVVLTFLNDNLLHHFPPNTKLATALIKTLTTGVLEKLLVPSLPSSVTALPAYLDLMKHAVHFEEEFIVGLLGDGHGEREIKSWADGIAGHYERKRRVELLEKARAIILREEAEDSTFRVDVVTTIPSPLPPTTAQVDRAASPEEEAWGFDGEAEASSAADADGWGFEDDRRSPKTIRKTRGAGTTGNRRTMEMRVLTVMEMRRVNDSSVWDDPWGDPATTKRLQTREAVQQEQDEDRDFPTNAVSFPPVNGATRIHVQTESYLVAGRMKELLALVDEIIREAADLTSSGVFSSHVSSHTSVGGTIAPTAASVLDLYRALYPVHAASKLASTAKWSLLFANNCTWLSGEVVRVDGKAVGAGDKLGECVERLREVGELWYEDVVETLAEAQGFVGTTDQERYDECEAAVNRVLQHVRRFSQQVKVPVGTVIDVALSRILGDVLALEDITAEESNKLSELCRIMNSLEGLFVENPDLPSFVVDYVPSWFKFSYLSELLEASMIDITYLFEEGALVDFTIEELVNLVRALFADTPARTNTINKLMQGHPSFVQSDDGNCRSSVTTSLCLFDLRMKLAA